MHLIIRLGLIFVEGAGVKHHHVRPPSNGNFPDQLCTVHTCDRCVPVPQVRAKDGLHVLEATVHYHNVHTGGVHLREGRERGREGGKEGGGDSLASFYVSILLHC